ncbi:hypothetical protein GCM10029963_63200 [Micromonospora andamanensis]
MEASVVPGDSAVRTRSPVTGDCDHVTAGAALANGSYADGSSRLSASSGTAVIFTSNPPRARR